MGGKGSGRGGRAAAGEPFTAAPPHGFIAAATPLPPPGVASSPAGSVVLCCCGQPAPAPAARCPLQEAGKSLGAPVDPDALLPCLEELVLAVAGWQRRVRLVWPYGGGRVELSGEAVGGWDRKVALAFDLRRRTWELWFWVRPLCYAALCAARAVCAAHAVHEVLPCFFRVRAAAGGCALQAAALGCAADEQQAAAWPGAALLR